jgi:predicted CoA-substrate-specific enzyme activase
VNWFAMGVDLGSTTAKTVVLDDAGALAGSSVVQMGAVSREAARVSADTALAQAGIGPEAVVRTVSTGYGRRLVAGADRVFTEITCHARGASVLWPGVRLVIDIGGQDSKVIAVDSSGLVDRFAMNDRCASGTGRFFDLLGRALEVGIEDIGALALQGSNDLEISSMCATFGETEVISLLAQGADKADIAASVHRAVAARTLGLVAQVGVRTPVVMTGGVAKNPAAVHHLSAALGQPIEVSADPQISGAYGAAMLARDDYLARSRPGAVDDATEEAQHSARAAAGGPGCADCGGGSAEPGSSSRLLQISSRS